MTLHKNAKPAFFILLFFFLQIYIQKMWASENWSGPLIFKT